MLLFRLWNESATGAEMPIYFLVGWLGKCCDAKAGQYKNGLYPSDGFFFSPFSYIHTVQHPSHVYIFWEKAESQRWHWRKKCLKRKHGLKRLALSSSPDHLSQQMVVTLPALFISTDHICHVSGRVRVPLLTWAMLVMKKGSQALKKSPRRTPSVRLAFSARRPCLWARRRSLFTDGYGQQRTTVNPTLLWIHY